MKALTTTLLFLALTMAAQAQSNQGKVSVKQSAEIDELVYGKKKQTVEKTKEQIKAEKKAAKKAEKEAKRKAKEEEKRQKEAAKKGQPTTQQTKPEPVTVVTPKLPEQKVAPKQEVNINDIQTAPRTKLVRRRVPVQRRDEENIGIPSTGIPRRQHARRQTTSTTGGKQGESGLPYTTRIHALPITTVVLPCRKFRRLQKG